MLYSMCFMASSMGMTQSPQPNLTPANQHIQSLLQNHKVQFRLFETGERESLANQMSPTMSLQRLLER